MDTHSLAQVIAFLGFLILTYGVANKSRRNLIGFDAAGLSLVTFHWYLLGAQVAVAVNAVFIANDLIALLLPEKVNKLARNAIAGILMLASGFIWFQETVDILPLIASALILFAIQQKNIQHLRLLMIVANPIWSLYGINHETWVQVAFGVIITAIHIFRFFETRRESKSNP